MLPHCTCDTSDVFWYDWIIRIDFYNHDHLHRIYAQDELLIPLYWMCHVRLHWMRHVRLHWMHQIPLYWMRHVRLRARLNRIDDVELDSGE